MNAQADFESVWVGKQCWCYAFEDTREAMGLSGSRRVFTKGRPSDYLVTAGGKTFFAEVKSSQNEVSFNLNNVEESQWQAAIRSVAAGGLYFFFIRCEVNGLWFQVPAVILVEQRKTKKSIKWVDLKPYFWKMSHEHK
jgi:penicillin-binding protein-related factor A (putative recombinase)